jgi:transcriptional regulator GlxA family with amidase domain
MDTQNTFTSAGITAGLYILYKLVQRYYFRSGCHNRTLEITVVDKEEEKTKEKEPKEEKRPEIELVIS